MNAAGSPPKAVLRFQPNWLQVQQGALIRGGELEVDFAPDRLTHCRRTWRGAEIWEIEAFVRFHPRGEITHGSVLGPIRARGGMTVAHSPVPFTVKIPQDTTQIEIWFHTFSQTSERCDAWDSRFGENYWFDVGGPDPVQFQRPVQYRVGAISSPELVNVLDQVASKKNVFPRRPNGGREGTDLRTSLLVKAWVRNIAFAKDVWVDVHVFDGDATLVSLGTFPLSWEASAGEAADLFRLDREIYRGSTATPGSVSPKPDARFVQYRLYYGVGGRVFTDSILHQLELPEDAVSH